MNRILGLLALLALCGCDENAPIAWSNVPREMARTCPKGTVAIASRPLVWAWVDDKKANFWNPTPHAGMAVTCSNGQIVIAQ